MAQTIYYAVVAILGAVLLIVGQPWAIGSPFSVGADFSSWVRVPPGGVIAPTNTPPAISATMYELGQLRR